MNHASRVDSRWGRLSAAVDVATRRLERWHRPAMWLLPLAMVGLGAVGAPWWAQLPLALVWGGLYRAHLHHERHTQQALVDALVAMERGEYDVRMAAAASPVVSAAFDRMTAAVRGQIGLLAKASNNVVQAGDDMSMSAQTLAIRTEEQTAVISQTTVAIDDVLQAVRHTSDMASDVDRTAQSLVQQAEHSREIVQGAVNAIERIRESSTQMSAALGVIDQLTFQTNILALNAAIEAARAGPAGRGFVVVAGEVRALAARTAQSAAEIKAIIERSNSEVSLGVQEIGSVRSSISRIGDGFRDVSRQMRDVSQSNLIQSGAIGLISQGLTQLSSLTEANTRLVVDSVAASERLRGSAQELCGRVAALHAEEVSDAAGLSVPAPGAPETAAANSSEPAPAAPAPARPASESIEPEGIEFF
ncbi:methyl-accepting chemotaxis protein [Ideonella sp. DXS29W]|uniref:Methyl-accepting chemotaxis protein n=1 Tax=Ideonella lacteola TaxID=2984193 RepID=A0ABU9BKS3_9BURK